jgi:uncharacterized membrane protein
MQKLTSLGQIFIAVAMIAFGLQHIIYMDFVTRVVPPLPLWIPFHPFLACLCGAFLIVAGISILSGKEARTMALLLGGALLLSFALLYVPQLFANPQNGSMWTKAGKALALSGGSFLIAGSTGAEFADRKGWRTKLTNFLQRFIPLGPYFLAAFLVLAGILHFIYVDFVMLLVPAWIPGQRFWAYFTGCALIAGGLGISLPPTRRWAALLTAGMIFVWVLVLHLPRALANLKDANETTAVFEALAMTGIAMLIASTHKATQESRVNQSRVIHAR